MLGVKSTVILIKNIIKHSQDYLLLMLQEIQLIILTFFEMNASFFLIKMEYFHNVLLVILHKLCE